MSTLRKPTFAGRATAPRELTLIVDAETDAEDFDVRRITLLLKPGYSALMSIDDPRPQDIAAARSYQLTQLSPGFPIRFKILADQKVYLMAEGGPEENQGMVQAGLIIEYLQES